MSITDLDPGALIPTEYHTVMAILIALGLILWCVAPAAREIRRNQIEIDMRLLPILPFDKPSPAWRWVSPLAWLLVAGGLVLLLLDAARRRDKWRRQ